MKNEWAEHNFLAHLVNKNDKVVKAVIKWKTMIFTL